MDFEMIVNMFLMEVSDQYETSVNYVGDFYFAITHRSTGSLVGFFLETPGYILVELNPLKESTLLEALEYMKAHYDFNLKRMQKFFDKHRLVFKHEQTENHGFKLYYANTGNILEEMFKDFIILFV